MSLSIRYSKVNYYTEPRPLLLGLIVLLHLLDRLFSLLHDLWNEATIRSHVQSMQQNATPLALYFSVICSSFVASSILLSFL